MAACEQVASRVGASSSAMVRCSRAASCPSARDSGPTTYACSASSAAARHHISIASSASPPDCREIATG